MANWTQLKTAIADVIKTNGNQEITGAILQNTLNSIVNTVGENATFAGVAIPSTNPGTSDGPVFYFAAAAGTYSNFSGLSFTSPGLYVLYKEGDTWKALNVLELSQTTGSDETKVMSQKAVTTELAKKVNTADIAQSLGTSTTVPMSQKATTDSTGVYNVDTNVPLGSGFYTATTARAAVPTAIRKLGLIITYKTDATTSVVEQYTGSALSGWTTDVNWTNVGSGGGNKILEWNTDVATTRKQVPLKERKSLLQISYKNADGNTINEQYVGTSFSDAEWVQDSNWDKIISEGYVGKLINSENIFPKNLISGHRISLTGSDEDVSGAIRTDYISVEPNCYYYTNKVFTKQEVYSVNFFTSSKSFISGAYLGSLNLFKTPENCAYIIINITAKSYVPIISVDGLTLAKDNILYPPIGNYQIPINRFNFKYKNLLNPYTLPLRASQYVYVKKAIGKKCAFVDSRKVVEVGVSGLAYCSFSNENGFEESDHLSSDFVRLNINLYGLSTDTIQSILSQIMVYELDDSNMPQPFIDYNGVLDDRQISSMVSYRYGNINNDVAMLTLSKESFSKLSPYYIETAYNFLTKEGDKNVIYYPAGQGFPTGDTSVYGRYFEIIYPKITVTNSCKFKQYIIASNTSVIIETDMPILDLLKSNSFCLYPVTGSFYGGYSNEVKNISDDTDITEVNVGDTYRLITYNSNKVYTYIQYVKILSDTSFKISFPDYSVFGNSAVESQWYTGKSVEFNPKIRINISYTITKDYWIKVHSPKYNFPNLIYPDDYLQNYYVSLYGTNLYVDTDESTVEQVQQKDILTGNYMVENPFKNTKIVWLGTSVPNEPPFGEGKTKKYPEFVALLLQAKVIVRAIGGTIMTYNPDKGRYGLSMTLEEYNSHKSEAGIERSYETQLEGCWDSDLFVFDHLHNDNGLLAALKDNPEYWDSDLQTFKITESNKFDRTWAVGAFNYVIAEIFRYNPRAKIAIINDWRAEPFYNKLANRVVADLWGIPICELRLCNGNVDITTTKDTYLKRYNGGANIKLLAGSSANPLYYQSKSAPDESSSVAEEETEITFNKGSDSIHPGRYGRIIYAKAVARWMLGNVILDNDTLDFFY